MAEPPALLCLPASAHHRLASESGGLASLLRTEKSLPCDLRIDDPERGPQWPCLRQGCDSGPELSKGGFAKPKMWPGVMCCFGHCCGLGA